MNMELPSLLHNGKLLNAKVLGENTLLIEFGSGSLQSIHSFSLFIDKFLNNGIVDVIPAYQSLAIVFDKKNWDHESLINELSEIPEDRLLTTESQSVIEIPVCYNLGLDWEEIINHTGLSREEIIQRHSSASYTIAMMGFIPGFIFLEGLKNILSVPRRPSPRTRVPSGSVGIGGSQTGIYSLESPGGWNIIGRTPVSFFDVTKSPPTKLKAGDQVRFIPISEQEFQNV